VYSLTPRWLRRTRRLLSREIRQTLRRVRLCSDDWFSGSVPTCSYLPGGRYIVASGSRNCNRGSEEIICYYQRPSLRLRSFLCLVQCSFPFFAGVILCLGLRKDTVSNLEVAMRWTPVAGCVAGTIKLLRRWGFADWAKERSGQRSTPSSSNECRVSRDHYLLEKLPSIHHRLRNLAPT
jgi:hypothetical protein